MLPSLSRWSIRNVAFFGLRTLDRYRGVRGIRRTQTTLALDSVSSPPTTNYNAEQIQVLEGLDPVRKRPGMYVGSTSQKGLHHLVYEVLDNAIDEVQAGFADTIHLEICLKEGLVSVTDNGRGIPTELHPQTKKSALETVLTVLHAGKETSILIPRISIIFRWEIRR